MGVNGGFSWLWCAAVALLLSGCSVLPGMKSGAEVSPTGPVEPVGEEQCPAEGEWRIAGETSPQSLQALLEKIDRQSIVLLGERHNEPADHRWQLHLLAALHGRFEGVQVGYEMFVREHQPVLDDWMAGRIDDSELREQSQWDRHWGIDFRLYETLLWFNRLQQVPAAALNVPRELVRRIGQDGWDSVPEDERYGLTKGAEPSEAYRDYLAEIADRHGHEAPSEEEVQAFIRAQGVWDRAMAQGLSDMARDSQGPVVGIVGRGHIENGYGIPDQLRHLGETSVWVLLPWREGEACLSVSSTPADALYGMPR